MQAYCNGFMIQPSTRDVLCILKNRPEFQAGKWNGIGGKLEPGESPVQAQVREFYEEAGVRTDPRDWEATVVLRGPDFCVNFFRSFVNVFPDYKTVTDELVTVIPAATLLASDQVLENMKWILPLQFSLNIKFPLTVQWQRLQ